jgi:serine protease
MYFQKLFFSFLCFFFIGQTLTAQVNLVPVDCKLIRSENYESLIVAGIINVIVKNNLSEEELNLAFESLKNKIPNLSLEKRFPDAVKPKIKVDKQGFRLADLTTHYRLRFNDNYSIEQAIKYCLKSALFEAIEPHFIPELCYVPNDDSISSQYALSRIKAFEAWEIEQGDSNIVIGISDTGCQMDHPDLFPNIAFNYNDPINGIDDDNDGYIDNFYGWDLGENDNFPQSNTSSHGVHVTGLSSAMTNNGIGIAGSGFRCRFAPLKITNANGALSAAYESIVYAADRGYQIINCSWGSYQPSKINFEIIRYATINKNALIFCGSGNNNSERQFFPAAYDFTISMGSSGPEDIKSDFSNYGYSLDLYAPGENVLSTWPTENYIYSNGTSMASPVAAGCAAIVKSKYPELTALQIAQLLKVTADRIDNIPDNQQFQNKLGYGRVNMFEALVAENKKSVLMHDVELSDRKENLFLPGDSIFMSATFTNVLNNVSTAIVNLNIIKGSATLLNAFYSLGSMSSLSFKQNIENPFIILIDENAPLDDTVVVRIDIWSDAQISTQYFQFNSNANFVKLKNNISTTINSVSEIGKVNNFFLNDRGFRYFNSPSLLFEGNFMLGFSPNSVYNMARSEQGRSDRDFQSIQRIRQLPSAEEVEQFEGYFDNRVEPNNEETSIRQKAYVPQTGVSRNYIVLDYEIKKEHNPLLTNKFFAGLFLDWDLPEYAQNRIITFPERKLAVAFNPQADTLFVGAKLLNNSPFFSYALDLNLSDESEPIDMTDGFSTVEKYYALRNSKLTNTADSDIAQMISTGPFFIMEGESVSVSFALLAASTLDSLLLYADDAQNAYDNKLQPLQTEMIEKGDFKIFPNPSKNESTFIQVPIAGDYVVNIFDAAGIKIFTAEKRIENIMKLDMKPDKGIYFVQLLDKQGKDNIVLKWMVIQ